MARRDLVSEEGLRLDGRSAEDLRKWDGLIGVVSTADGSAYLSQGQTKVLVTIAGPKEGATESSRSAYLKPRVSVNISWNTATFSDAEQRSRPRLLNHFAKEHSSKMRTKSFPDRRIISFISVIKDCLENVIIAKALPNAHIDAHVNVLSSDGSVLSCVTNALSLALMDAGIPMRDVFCATSAGLAPLPSTPSGAASGRTRQAQLLLSKEYLPIVDVSGQEELGYMLPVLTCAFLPRTNELVFCHLESKVSLSELTSMTEAAENAVPEIQTRLKDIVIKRYS